MATGYDNPIRLDEHATLLVEDRNVRDRHGSRDRILREVGAADLVITWDHRVIRDLKQPVTGRQATLDEIEGTRLVQA